MQQEQHIHINEYKDKRYYKNQKMTIRHWLDGPAVEYADGGKEWYVDGKRHRLDGPAVEYVDGYKEWYVEGQFHRLDGPAVEDTDGRKQWYVDGKNLSEEAFNKRLQPKMTIVIEGKKYKLVEL
jgi:hypothetical protein